MDHAIIPTKSKAIWFITNALAGFCDLGLGVLSSASIFFYMDPHVLYSKEALLYLAVGGIFALSPDFDIVAKILRADSIVADHHTSFFHRPIKFIPTMWVLTALFAVCFDLSHTLSLEVLATVCICCHYLHDTRLFGDGDINLLYPFGKDPKMHILHNEWLMQWTKPTQRSVGEIIIGLTALAIGLSISHLSFLVVPTVALVSSLVALFWLLLAVGIQRART